MKLGRIAPYTLLLLPLLLLTNCHCSRKALSQPMVEERPTQADAGLQTEAPALIYKTRNDYSKFVPVLMNAEKNRIISYPAPTDILSDGTFSYPTQLANGYLLDNRGIGPDVAFLNITYEAYSQLKQPLSMDKMLDSILDRNPLLELWNCGARSRFLKDVNKWNTLIDSGFTGCKLLFRERKVTLQP